MPLSSAERCRRYREKLKQENPSKFEEIKKRNLERTKAKKRKIADMNENEKQHVRKQWRDAKRKKNKSENEAATVEAVKARRRYRSQVGRENLKLKEKVEMLRRKNENYRKIITRSRIKIQRLTAELSVLKSEIESRKDINQLESVQIYQDNLQNLNQLTPMTKANSFIDEELPNISNEAKQRVKVKLLQHHVIEESLKETYKICKPFQERKILKKLAESETVKKYNMKTNLTKCLGFKSGIKRYYTIKQKRIKTANELKKFYERDDVSRMTAGKKEYVTNQKIQRQKRFLLDTLLKLYKKYKSEGGTVSFTTFKRYRPFYVVSPKLCNRNTCACIKHSNLVFKAETLKKLGLIKTTDLTNLVSQIVCDVKTKCCMYSECEVCREKHLNITVDHNQDMEVSWFEFVSKSHEYEKDGEKKKSKKMVKLKQTGFLSNLVMLMQRDLKKFKAHHYNIYHQYKQYKEAIDKVEDNEVILHCDFSENYICKMAEEVQAMHFGSSKIQVTLHTGVLYIKNEKPLCFCTVSPSLKHGPEAIWAHLKPVIDFIKEKFPAIVRIHIWSDGPTTQYRQKKNFFLFCEITKKEGFREATWSFFEASHGKGAADGVGGVVKRTLDAKVTYGEDIVDARSAYNILLKSDLTVKTFYVAEEDIDRIVIKSPEKILPIPSTMQVHQVITTQSNNTIKYRPLSCFCSRGNCDCFFTKIHLLTKADNTEKQEKVKNQKSKKINKILDSSSENTDTEIEYAESDTSSWNEVEYLTYDIEDQESQTDTETLIQNIVNRSEIENNWNEKVKINTEEEKEMQGKLHNVTEEESGNKEKEKEKGKVKILSEIRYTPENCKYYDLKKFGKMWLKEGEGINMCPINKPLAIQSKTQKENKDNNILYTDAIPSCSGVKSTITQESDKEQYEISLNDVVLIRYYIRKTWKYYVGFVTKIDTENDKTLYTITFLKTVKSPKLTFVKPKKVDLDIITNDSIVKKIRLSQQSKEYYLVDEFDEIYFV